LRGIYDTVKRYELESAAESLEQVIQAMAKRENEERDKLSRRYTESEKEARDYQRGFSEGYEAGRQKGYAEGFDAGLKQAAQEKEKEDESH
jgi:flagellar biosynthesis/type III secretory pathway protein FliH